jgi:hypothetical protein
MPDIVVLLPGIMGSVLQKDGKTLWGFSGKILGSVLFSRGRSLRETLAFTDDQPDVDDLGDGITAPALMPDIHLLPGVWKIDGYSKVANTILERFEVREGENFFRFPYDWRRDNRANARRLQRESHDWLKRWREKSPGAKLVLVAHSMGGLISRYFLEVLDGWKDTRALISFGTPYRGSLNAVDAIANGIRKGGLGLTLVDLTELGRSLTSLYQLLPVYPCYDTGDGVLHRVGEIDGIPNMDAARARDALAFHNEIRSAVDEHLKSAEYRDQRYRVHPVVGVSQETNQSARRHGNGVQVLMSLGGKDLSGDGTVPRVSATPIEYSDANVEMFAATKHGSLQNADAVLTQLEGVMTGFAIDLGQFLDQPARHIAVSVEDAYFDDEPVVIRGRARGRPDAAITARILDGDSDAILQTLTLAPVGDEWRTAESPPLTAGAYRVQLMGQGLDTAEDSFVVAPRTDV